MKKPKIVTLERDAFGALAKRVVEDRLHAGDTEVIGQIFEDYQWFTSLVSESALMIKHLRDSLGMDDKQSEAHLKTLTAITNILEKSDLPSVPIRIEHEKTKNNHS